MGFFSSLFTFQFLVSLILVAVVCYLLFRAAKGKGAGKSLSTRDVVAIGIGAALYGVISMIYIPIGPNTSFRLAIAILVIFGALYGPTVGFLVGFIGHALNDAIMWGSVWWSWVFLSAVIGLFAGLIQFQEGFDALGGKIDKSHIIKMYIYGLVGILAGSLVAYLGDVVLYGEPADKVWLQIILASISNFAVIAVLGIPAVIALGLRKKKITGLEVERAEEHTQ